MITDFVYIYNSAQGIYYISKGLIPTDFGTGNKGDAFMQFKKDELYCQLFREWCEICRNNKEK